jgi:transposase
MQEERLGSGLLRFNDPRRERCWSRKRFRRYSGSTSWGWGTKRIAWELGISRNTVKDYIAAGGWTPYRQPRRKKALDCQEAWLRERYRGNADVIGATLERFEIDIPRAPKTVLNRPRTDI